MKALTKAGSLGESKLNLLVVKVVAIIEAIGEAVVTCGHEVSHGTRVTEPGEIPTRVGLVIFLGTRGPVGRDGRQSVPG